MTGEKTDRQKHVKTKRCCKKETRNGANTRIEQHLKGIMLAWICSKNRHKRTVEEKNEKMKGEEEDIIEEGEVCLCRTGCASREFRCFFF